MTTDDYPGVPFSALRDTGVLWLINRSVFHPRGFALALNVNDHGDVTGWTLLGDGSEPWRYVEAMSDTEDELFRAVEDLFASHRSDDG